MYMRASQLALVVKNTPAMQETQEVQSLYLNFLYDFCDIVCFCLFVFSLYASSSFFLG